MNSSDKQFEQRARARYQEAIQSIDPVTAGRLRAARRTALEVATVQASPHHRVRVLLPVGALAAMALAALMVWQPSPQPEGKQVAVTEQQDNEYLPPEADKADPGLYQNLDFYSWLAANNSDQAKR
ncbi:hypothetical protein [Dyella sp.]|uniref:hypothetical protein n=1 Tax=Dyella sp. TaxID=1869338 RepID=UPI002B48FCE9|nr:hypothetical protein [Dyella sp.]HKT29253.1 hypothetical protein [Dyella sp.]